LDHEFYFPFHIWDVILCIDFHIFQDGYCTTNQNILKKYFLGDYNYPFQICSNGILALGFSHPLTGMSHQVPSVDGGEHPSILLEPIT